MLTHTRAQTTSRALGDSLTVHQGRVQADTRDEAAMAARAIVGDDAKLTIRGPMPDGQWNYYGVVKRDGVNP